MTHHNPKQFTGIPNEVILAGLSEKAIYIYLAIALHANWETGECWPSQNRIMGITGIKRRETVRKYVQELVDAGFISVQLKKCTYANGVPYGRPRNHYCLEKPARQMEDEAKAFRNYPTGARYSDK